MLKYSTIVIAEAIGSLFQHILAKKHSAAVRVQDFETFVKKINELYINHLPDS